MKTSRNRSVAVQREIAWLCERVNTADKAQKNGCRELDDWGSAVASLRLRGDQRPNVVLVEEASTGHLLPLWNPNLRANIMKNKNPKLQGRMRAGLSET